MDGLRRVARQVAEDAKHINDWNLGEKLDILTLKVNIFCFCAYSGERSLHCIFASANFQPVQ